MKRSIFLFSLLWSSVSFLAAQTPAVIQKIRKQYAHTVKAKDQNLLTVKAINYKCPDSNYGGAIRFFYEKGNLRLIEHEYNLGDHYGCTTQYFVWDDALYFAFSSDGIWAFDAELSNGNFETIDQTTQLRFYFEDGKPIRCLRKEYTFRSALGSNQPSIDDVPNESVECSEAPLFKQCYEALLQWEDDSKDGNPCDDDILY